MTYRLDTAPATEPVTLADAKQHMRVDGAADDVLIEDLIAAARRYLDGRHGRLGRALITQTWTLTLATWPRVIELDFPPVQAVGSIEYVDPAGTTQTLDPAKYRVRGLNATEPATVRRAPDAEWPDVADDPEAITVTFTAGYGDNPADVPEPIRHALKLLIADWYDKREASMAVNGLSEIPTGVEDIVTQYRNWAF